MGILRLSELMQDCGIMNEKANFFLYSTDFSRVFCDLVSKASYNFLALAASGYYDNTLFHRNMKGFMLQGGDPTGTGKGTFCHFLRHYLSPIHCPMLLIVSRW